MIVSFASILIQAVTYNIKYCLFVSFSAKIDKKIHFVTLDVYKSSAKKYGNHFCLQIKF